MITLVLFVMGGLLAATEGCGAGKQMLSKLLTLLLLIINPSNF